MEAGEVGGVYVQRPLMNPATLALASGNSADANGTGALEDV